eukprot:TRINITY_DN1180_c0_g1_i2.p1 TRINITY_DN1180_c0_g1~~TRINITY_DN1180_c0_g1_i2.p1  ORF type:complete len:1007 (-),score=358.15 TRINITY_DN1180_c0_g1_i2:243-3263(-)
MAPHTPAPPALSSAVGILALLDEPDSTLKTHALHKLSNVVNVFWAEISESITKIEALSEDESFPERQLASLVASKVYYHLGEIGDALSFALGAGSLFDQHVRDEYYQTLTAQAIDSYSSQRVEAEGSDNGIDSRLVSLVESMFERCYADGQLKQAIGIGLECRRLDQVKKAISLSTDLKGTLSYTYETAKATIKDRAFRFETVRTLIELYRQGEVPDYENIVSCLTYMDDAPAVAAVLKNLTESSETHVLLGYQIAFGLADSQTQHFLRAIMDNLPAPTPAPVAPPAPAAAAASSGGDGMEVDGGQGDASKAEAAATIAAAAEVAEDPVKKAVRTLHSILQGEISINLYLEFLYRHNHTDLLLLKNIKNSIDARNSVLHGAIVMTNALMHAGTTIDTFLRENLEWFGRATHWSKFTATASIAMIHRGHLKQSLQLLAPYLPQGAPSTGGGAYSEAGALFGLGLIHANHGADMSKTILEHLKNAGANETLHHGACLGLGITAMSSGDENIYDNLKHVLFTDSAVGGEAAGIAMGLVMMGSAAESVVDEMLAYARETQHEKIVRGLAMGIAFVMYKREQGADVLIDQLLHEKDAILRHCAMLTIAMAYCGTANNKAVRKCLSIAVSDVNDDVRRVAVIALGFLLFNNPEQCPRMVSLLAESYNPHVRYGATFALGISCAGTGRMDALNILLPMAKDPVDYVRQGALIALSMVMIEATEESHSKVKEVRELFKKVYSDKHEDTMAKLGAILASGIIDAGGRNVTLSLKQTKKRTAVVGMALFSQFWYWHPLMPFLSLSFTPTALIALNKDLRMPKFQFKSAAPPVLFAYPEPTLPPTTKAVKTVKTAVLSAAARKKDKDAKKEGAAAGDNKMQVDEEKKEDNAASKTADKANEEEEKKKKEEEEKAVTKKNKSDAKDEVLQNPARVLPQQESYIVYLDDERYQPVVKSQRAGFVLLIDTKPDEPEDLVEVQAPQGDGAAAGGQASGTTAGGEEETEPSPPEPFEYVEEE